MASKTSARRVAPLSGVRPKGPSGPAVPKRDKRQPKTVREVDDRLKRLGPYPEASDEKGEAYDGLTRRRLDWTRMRSHLWALRRELAQKTDNDAIRNKGTVPLAIEDSEGQKEARKNATRVRQSEAWRHKQLDAMQRQAEIEMEAAWRSRTAGLGVVTAKYGSVGGGGDVFTVSAAMEQTWVKWNDQAQSKGVHRSAFATTLTEPLTLIEVEQAYRLRSGAALANFVAGLNLWCALRGWSRSTQNPVKRPLAPPG